MTAMEIYAGTDDATRAQREQRRKMGVAALMILGVAMVATIPGWMPGRVFVGDDGGALAARMATEYAAGRLAKGEIPLWNPSGMLGGPVIGDGQTGVFFPTILLHMILPSTWAWTISAVVRLWVAGFGVVVLARLWKQHGDSCTAASPVGQAPPYDGAILAGALYMLSGMSMGLLNTSAMNVLPLLPWGMIIAGALFTRITAARLLGATMFFLMVLLGGNDAGSVAVLLASMLFVAWNFLNEPGAAGRALGAMLAVVGAAGAAWLMAAIHWMPAYFNGREGGNVFVVIEPVGEGMWMVWWVGLVPLGLAVLAAVKGWRTREVLFWMTLVVVSVLVYAGARGMGEHRSALLGPAVLAVAILSGRGLDVLAEMLKIWPWLVSRVTAAVAGVALLELLVIGVLKNQGSYAPSDEMLAAVKWVESEREASTGAASRFAGELEAVGVAGNVTAPPTMMPTRVDRMWEVLRARVVKYLITERTIGPGADEGGVQWKVVYPTTQRAKEAGGVVVYENVSRPLPRAWVARNALWVADAGEALAKMKEADFDPLETVILDRGDEEETDVLRGRRAPIVGTRGGVGGNVQIVEDSPERVRVSTQAAAGGWLVLADAYAPGWRAKMSYVAYQRSSRRGAAEARSYERELAIVPANGAMRAVALQGGAEVVFEYAPQGWKKGLMISGIGLMVLLILVGATMFSGRDDQELAGFGSKRIDAAV
jgi:hypothetical protein